MEKKFDFAGEGGGRHVHFMGVCGVGMAGVAYLLAKEGWRVTGCDSLVNSWADGLKAVGVPVTEGHDPKHLADAECLVVTPAVHPDNPELVAARARGIPVYRRGEALAEIVSARRGVAVCGTHGKTTTTCFTTRLLQELGAAPGWCIGGATRALGFVAGQGASAEKGAPLVVEADESDGTLAFYHPAVLVLNNIDPDHLEHFKGLDDLHDCFKKAVIQAKEAVVVCRDHPVAWSVARHATVPVISFGLSAEADLRAEGITCDETGAAFTLTYKGKSHAVKLPVTGSHNVLNAMGAVGACLALGYPLDAVLAAVPAACAELPGRRFETVYAVNGVRVVADYAHHPVELKRAVQMALLFRPKRLRVVFQPHRYTRTLALRDQFPEAFEGADEMILLPVYAASEDPVLGGSIADLYAAFRKAGAKALLARSVEEVFEHLTFTVRPGDLILVAGAGDIIALADRIREEWADQNPDGEGPEMPKGLDLAPYSFFHVGGKALGAHDWPDERSFCHVMSVPAPEEYPRRVVGMGSNSWFSDLFWPGSVMRLAAPKDGGISECVNEGGAVGAATPAQEKALCAVSCGVKGGVLLDWLEERGFSGLECMDSIPGTVGGWLAMNAGVKDGSVGDRVAWIRCLNPDGKVATLQDRECAFGYRTCAALKNRVALACGLSLTRSTPEAVKAARLAYRAKRIPLAGLRTCGSVFRNPPGDSAGRLLDAAGCKGLRVGGARVTEFHANIIATEEGASASDVLALALLMRNRVRAQEGIELVPEIAGLEFGDCE